MNNFGYLKQLDVSAETTKEYTFHNISVNGKCPVFVVRPATEANKSYFNAVLKYQAKRAKDIQAGNLNVRMLEDSRSEAVELFPQYVVIGWRDVSDGDGKDVPFSEESCREFLKCLPNDIFDDFRTFCGATDNYRDDHNIRLKTKEKN